MSDNVLGLRTGQPSSFDQNMRPLYPQRHHSPNTLTAGWVEGANATEPEAQCYQMARALEKLASGPLLGASCIQSRVIVYDQYHSESTSRRGYDRTSSKSV
jgi:hypothetical protein